LLNDPFICPDEGFCVKAPEKKTGAEPSSEPDKTLVSEIVPLAVMPSELAVAVTEVIVSVSTKVPKAVVNDFSKLDPRVVRNGFVKVTNEARGANPVLSVRMVVTKFWGLLLVMEVVVVRSPVLEDKVPSVTKLNEVEMIVSAKAGEAAVKTAQATAARSAWREFTTLMTASLID
jgi:hypothetical protein